jgi:pimeloyl-ACP methyl ester carboxylesterase
LLLACNCLLYHWWNRTALHSRLFSAGPFHFNPEKLRADFQFKYDVPFRELNFDVKDGVRINGLHFYRNQPKGLILYFHGNTKSIKGWAKYAKDFYRYDYDVVLVDYRGFGKSTGQRRNENDLLNDMQFVYSWLAATIPKII